MLTAVLQVCHEPDDLLLKEQENAAEKGKNHGTLEVRSLPVPCVPVDLDKVVLVGRVICVRRSDEEQLELGEPSDLRRVALPVLMILSLTVENIRPSERRFELWSSQVRLLHNQPIQVFFVRHAELNVGATDGEAARKIVTDSSEEVRAQVDFDDFLHCAMKPVCCLHLAY